MESCTIIAPEELEETEEYYDLERETRAKVHRLGNDPVNHPSHYTDGGIETIDFIEAKNLPYHLGNAIKYISRAGKKNDEVEDLEKAIWYINRYVQLLRKGR